MTVYHRPLRTIYYTLLLTNYTLLTSDTVPWCTKILFPTNDFRFLFHRKNYISPLTVPPFSHLTFCTATKSNLYLANSLAAAAVSEPALYRLLTFKVQNLMSLFRCLVRTKVSVHVRCFLCEHFVIRCVFTVRSC